MCPHLGRQQASSNGDCWVFSVEPRWHVLAKALACTPFRRGIAMPTRNRIPQITRRLLVASLAAAAVASPALSPAIAQETVKLGLVAAMSGQSASRARPLSAACRSRSTRSPPPAGFLGRSSSWSFAMTRATPPKAWWRRASWCSASRSRPCSAASIRPCRSPSCHLPIRARYHSWACGRRHPDHPQRRRGKLCVPGVGRRCTGRPGARRLRDEEIFGEDLG